MFTERDYLFQVERHQDQIRYAEQQEVLRQLPKSLGIVARLSRTVVSPLEQYLSSRREALRSRGAPSAPHAEVGSS